MEIIRYLLRSGPHFLSVTLLVLAGILSLPLLAQPNIIYSDKDEMPELGKYAWILKDRPGTLSFEQVKALPDSSFTPSTQEVLNFGNTHSRIWLKFNVENRTHEELYTLFKTQDVEWVDVYVISPDSTFYVPTGTLRAYKNRYFLTNSIILKIGTHPAQIFIALRSGSRLHFPIRLGAIQPLVSHLHKETLFNGGILGIMLVMTFINLCIYFMIQDRTYLYYSCYVLMSGLTFMLYEALTFDLFWRHTPSLNDSRISFVVRVLTFAFAILFSTKFLHTKRYLPRLHRFFNILLWVLLVLGCMKIANLQIVESIFYRLSLLGFVSLFIAGIGAYRAGYQPARYYLVAWSFFILGAMSSVLALLDVLSFKHLFTAYGYAAGAACEASFLSFALVDRLNTYRKENLRSQQLAIEQLKENEKLVREQNRLLEEKVVERTRELRNSIGELELKNGEVQRQQSEIEAVRMKNIRVEFAKKLAGIKLRSLRDQMNPHFLFNCMNTIEAYIIENRPDEATAFLQKFSKLIRATLENSQYETILIKKEVEALELYIQLEEVRVSHRFSHTFEIEPLLLEQPYTIPPLLIQPYVENAILHGLRHKREGQGLLRVSLFVQHEQLQCVIEDNGVGRQKAAAIQTNRPEKKQSLGMKFTSERLAVMSEISSIPCQMDVIDLADNGHTGTKVVLTLPLIRQG